MNMNETVAGLTITAKTEGVDQAKKQVDGLTQSTEQLGVASQQTSKSTLSLEDAWKKQTLRLDEAARAQANMARETKIADAMLREQRITAEQHAERLNLINQRYGQATIASKAFAAATSGVSAQLVALSAGAGPVGTFLSALGPWGMAAAVGLGAVGAVFDRLNEGAKRIGDKSIELKKFSDVTGLTVTEIKGLTKAGAELGVSSDDITRAIERFSVGLDAAHKGTGDLFDRVRQINPALALQLAETRDTAQGWDILAEAIKGATNEAQRNALARAAFGRGGLEAGLVAISTANAGGLDVIAEKIAKSTGLTQQWVAETAKLRAENIVLEKSIANMTDAAYALPMLQRQNEFLKIQKDITQELLRTGGAAAKAQAEAEAFVAASVPGGAAPALIEMRRDLESLTPRGPSEGAMLAQEEARAQRDLAAALNEVKQAREGEIDAIARANNLERERIGLLGNTATEYEKLTLRLNQLKQAQLEGKLSETDYNRARAGAINDYDERIEKAAKSTRTLTNENEHFNRQAEDGAKSWSVQMDEANDAINRVTNSIGGMSQGVRHAINDWIEWGETIDQALTRMSAGDPFNPAGYMSTTSQSAIVLAAAQAKYGAGNFDIKQFAGGGIMAVSNKAEDVVGSTEWYNKMFPAIEKLTDATKANTAATQTQTDVLSPFYSSDPRRTHLGFRAFAGGGIMTPYGELPLKQYQGGGIATSPQVAVFGEGSTPEAYVPAPAGRIPVELKVPANSNQRPVNVTINVMGNADANTVAALKSTAFQQAQTMRRAMR